MEGVEGYRIMYRYFSRSVIRESQNCVGIVKSGSGKLQFHSLAMSIFSICVKNSINIDIEWIPRDENVKVDAVNDGMGTNSDFDSAYLDSVFVSQTLSNAGFVVNIEKSIWKPCQELVWSVIRESQNCVGIVKSGSGKLQLHSLAMSIFSICVKNSINIDIEWIPRDENVKVDAVSKIFDFDDCGVSVQFFEFIDSMYGPHSVDRFANSNNKKIELFNSRFYTPGSSGVDTFSFDWKGATIGWSPYTFSM
ncbi:unnamed protein product [Mytilus coruscus]|uniref:RNase H type-1 domain-containing protein n=1 Tax=Mytilus coruscus TaxID=42192 RepID=A0A6J8CDJ4_MYTCO|nr:unnamed protein product [Mytilus coruscus]